MNIFTRELMTPLKNRKILAGMAAPMLIVAPLGSGVASGHASPEVGSLPDYHWCPGDFWRPEWGFNWHRGVCHDDHHRDIDGFSHDNDWWP